MAIELLTPFTKVELEPEIKEKKRKQVGILGGNFNPVHNAHLIVADQVRQQLGLDQVLLMPEYQPPHVDKKETIPEHHRLKMLELAIEGIEGRRAYGNRIIDSLYQGRVGARNQGEKTQTSRDSRGKF